jgi:hypothetical protein
LDGGVLVKLKELPFKVKIFKLVSTNWDIKWFIINDLSVGMNAFVVELKNENRWQVEEFHRGFKQLRGSEKCQCRKAVSQRNHLSCCYLAWVNLKLQALKIGKTIYQVRQNIVALFLENVLQNPICPAFV